MNKFRGKKHYIMTKAWQRSSVGHPARSRCRHAKRKVACGYRYKGGR